MLWNKLIGSKIGGASAVSSMTFIASANADAASITIPATAAIGDMCLFFDLPAFVSSVPPSVTPAGVTGWTSVTSFQHAQSNANLSFYVWGKVLKSGDAGSSVFGSNINTNAGVRRKILYVFRPDAAISSFDPFSIVSEATPNDPAAQTVPASSGNSPLITFAIYRGYASVLTTATYSPTPTVAVNSGTTARVSCTVQNGTPFNITADLGDTGTVSALQTFYLEIT